MALHFGYLAFIAMDDIYFLPICHVYSNRIKFVPWCYRRFSTYISYDNQNLIIWQNNHQQISNHNASDHIKMISLVWNGALYKNPHSAIISWRSYKIWVLPNAENIIDITWTFETLKCH